MGAVVFISIESNQCRFFLQLLEACDDAGSYKRAEKVEMVAHVEFICDHEVAGVIGENMTQAKTALVTSEKYLTHYWKIFEAETSRNSSMRFYDNHHIKNDFATIRHHYETTAVSSLHKFGMQRTLSVIFSSGIYSLFERWDSEGLKEHVGHHNEKGNPRGPGLSMQDSDVRMTFEMLACCLVTCVMSFVAEIILRIAHKLGNNLRRATLKKIRFLLRPVLVEFLEDTLLETLFV